MINGLSTENQNLQKSYETYMCYNLLQYNIDISYFINNVQTMQFCSVGANKLKLTH